MQTNIKKIRIKRNAFEVPVEPRMDDAIYFQGSGQITQKTDVSNQNGTVNTVYDLKPDLIEIKSAQYDKEDVTIVKDFVKNKSRSQSHRNLLYRLWVEKGSKNSFEGYYNSIYDAYDKKIQDKIDKEKMGY